MAEQPVDNARRKMLRDLLGLAVGGAVTTATRSFPVLPTGGEGEAPLEQSGQDGSWVQARLAETTGLSLHQIGESHLDDLLLNLRANLRRGETTIRIPREKLVGFLATYAGAKFYQEKRVTLSDIQFSKEENGIVFDIIAHASFGRLFVRVRTSPISEGEVSEFVRLRDAMGMEEGWLVAPGLENKLVRGEPVALWENRYVIPVVRLMSYDPLFDWLLPPTLLPSVKRTVVTEDQNVVLHLSLEPGPRAKNLPGALEKGKKP